MLVVAGRSCRTEKIICLLIVFCTLSARVQPRSYHVERNANITRRTTHEHGNKKFSQKKPRSAQLGILPQLQTVYSRQNIPVRLASVPANSYRLPITATRRLENVVAPLSRLPALQRTYIPVVGVPASLSTVPYPGVEQQDGLAGRYVLPYGLKMPPSRLSTQEASSQEFGRHYNTKFNSLPTMSNMDLDQDAPNLGGKTESKKMELDDDFDHFLDSLDGPCSKNPCRNGAKCRISSDGSSFHCICKKEFKGKTCEDRSPCFPNPCNNNGQCTLTSEGFECSCPKGFKGKTCEQQNKCDPNPCENDGICNELTNGEFECTCKKGFFGDKCQVSKTGCDPNPCLNEGRCSELGSGDYECTCAPGYTGKTCETSDNKCQSNPCQNGGSCLQAMTSLGYECSCRHGFRGLTCEDHSGCDVNSCQNGGTCYETEFGVRCICRNGYSGDRCQVRKFCDTDTCQNNGKCIEHATGFHCKCSEGFKGETCEEMDRCHPNPCHHGGQCEQSDAGYLCKCTSQYQGLNCEVQNPCGRNPCKNGGKCINGIGTEYQCQCPNGYLGHNCDEWNACESSPCQNGGMCRRYGDDFTCECQEGYEGKTCENSDPCRNNPCQHDGVCKRNGATDYTCTCAEDYKGSHCETRKPCHPNPCMNDGMCEESNKDFICSCKEGFRGRNCEEQDQCVPNPCKNGGRCASLSTPMNGRGFSCECVNSFYGDTCEERDPCHPNPCANNGKCTEINGGFTCQCSVGFQGDRCREIDKCNPNPCQHQGTCTEVVGGLGYACRCPYGYKGQDCQQKDYCHPNPCDHDGQCVAMNNDEGFKCKCPYGYRGRRCSDVNPCEPNPCGHDSECIILPGFGINHMCNCSLGWTGDTCQKREMCKPNPCQFGTKCVETGDDSYSCVKSMCHPNPCQNSGKCINVNEDNFQCACTEAFEGKICDGDEVSTHPAHRQTNDGNNWTRSLITEPVNKPETTNIDDLLKLVDTTLDAYTTKYSLTKTKITNKIDKVTRMNNKLYNNPDTRIPTRRPKYGDEVDTNDDNPDTNNDGDSTTYHDRSTKKQNVKDATNSNDITSEHDENDKSDSSELDDDLVKSINPDGGVVVDNPEQSTAFRKQTKTNNIPATTAEEAADKRYKPTAQTDIKQTNLEDKITDDIHDEEAFIKSINPEGEVVVNSDSQVPRRRQPQLFNAPSSQSSMYAASQQLVNRAKYPSLPLTQSLPQVQLTQSLPQVQLTQSLPQVTMAGVKSEKPPKIPMSEIASCSPLLCQNDGVCIQEAGKPIRCKCKPSFTGDTCELSKCQRNPCRNGGMCLPVKREPGFVCKCRDGLTGPLCSRKPCEPNPCKNGGNCVVFYSVYLCKCKAGYEGKHCEDNLGVTNDHESDANEATDENLIQANNQNHNSYGSVDNDGGSANDNNNYNDNNNNNHDNNNNNSNHDNNNHDSENEDTATGQNKNIKNSQNNENRMDPTLYNSSPLTTNDKVFTSHAGSKTFVLVPDEEQSKSKDKTLLLTTNGVDDRENEADLSKAVEEKMPHTPESAFRDSPSAEKEKEERPQLYQDNANNDEIEKDIHLFSSFAKDRPYSNDNTVPDVVTATSNNVPQKLQTLQDTTEQTKDERQGSETVPQVVLKDYSNGMKTVVDVTNNVLPIPASPSTKNLVASDTESKDKVTSSSFTKNSTVSVCHPTPCKNNGQCVESSDGEYQCICSEHFSGPRCEDKGVYRYSSAPKFFPGENEECKHCDKNARCVNGHCICRNKFVGDGLECWKQTQRDKLWSCDQNPCQNGGTCKPGIARCVCRLGYVGDYCEEYSPPVVHLTFDKLVDGNKLMDMSGNGNDAQVFNGFQIAPKEGKCESAGNLLGGDILFDGEHFRGIPRRAITIAVWVKLSTALGIQSIFDTVGSHSSHADGQYHFEIDNGRVRWFHRNEEGQTVLSVVTDQVVVGDSEWNMIVATYSSKKNRARIFVNGDMIKEESARGMPLSGDWGEKAGIATLTELDVPLTNEDENNINTLKSDNMNNHQRPNVIQGYALLKDDNKDEFNRMNQDDNNINTIKSDNMNNHQRTNVIQGYALVKDDKNDKVNKMIQDDNINKNSNNENMNTDKDDLSNLKRNANDNNEPFHNLRRKDIVNGMRKHQHLYGARVLRGMVDEFSIFPVELSRLQILVLMTHCKVYYNQAKQIAQPTFSPTQFKQTFTEAKAYAPATESTLQSGGWNPPASYQQPPPSAQFNAGYASGGSNPAPYNNYPPSYNYRSGQTFQSAYSSPGSYYSNTAGMPQYQSTYQGGGQPGYQRLQAVKSPSTPPYAPGFSRTARPLQSAYGNTRVPERPNSSPYVLGSYNTGIPVQVGYQTAQTRVSPAVAGYVPVGRQASWEYTNVENTNNPLVNQYASEWSATLKSKPQEVDYARTQAAGPIYQSQENSNLPSYNGYAAPQAKQPLGQNYLTPQSQGGTPVAPNNIPASQSTSQQRVYAPNGQYSMSPNDNTVFGPSYQTTNPASTGARHTSVPQTQAGTRYATAQRQGSIWGGQYRPISTTGRGKGGRYAPVQPSGYKSSGGFQPVTKGNTLPGFAKPRQRDAAAMTSSPYGYVRASSYKTDSQSQPQNAYANQAKNYDANYGYNKASYANMNSPESWATMNKMGNSGLGPFTSPYIKTTQYASTASNAYPASSGTDVGAARESIQKSIPQSANQNLQNTQVFTNQNTGNGQRSSPAATTTRAQPNGPLYDRTKYSPSYRQLDMNGQYPSDVQYESNNAVKTGAPERPPTITFSTADANTATQGTLAVQQPGITQGGNGQLGSQGVYNSWSTGSQTPNAAGQWNPNEAQNAKVDQAVMYTNGVNTLTSQTTATPTATISGTTRGIPSSNNINMDSVVQRAFADFLTTHIARKKKRRKKRQDDKDVHRTTTRSR